MRLFLTFWICCFAASATFGVDASSQRKPTVAELERVLRNFDKTPFSKLPFISALKRWKYTRQLEVIRCDKFNLSKLKKHLPALRAALMKGGEKERKEYLYCQKRINDYKIEIAAARQALKDLKMSCKWRYILELKSLKRMENAGKTSPKPATPRFRSASSNRLKSKIYDRSKIPAIDQYAVSKESGGEIRKGSCYNNAEMQGVLWWCNLGLCRIPPGSGSPALRVTRALTHFSAELYWRKYGNKNYTCKTHNRVSIKKLPVAACGLNICTLLLMKLKPGKLEFTGDGHQVTVLDFDIHSKRLRFNTVGKTFTVYLKSKKRAKDVQHNWRKGYPIKLLNQDWFVIGPLTVYTLHPIIQKVSQNRRCQ